MKRDLFPEKTAGFLLVVGMEDWIQAKRCNQSIAPHFRICFFSSQMPAASLKITYTPPNESAAWNLNFRNVWQTLDWPISCAISTLKLYWPVTQAFAPCISRQIGAWPEYVPRNLRLFAFSLHPPNNQRPRTSGKEFIKPLPRFEKCCSINRYPNKLDPIRTFVDAASRHSNSLAACENA